jgi:hypothetical protein
MASKGAKSACSIRVLSLIAAGILLHAPSVVCAGPDESVGTTELVSAEARRDVRRSLVFAMNKGGDMVMQCADLSVTMVRQPFDDNLANRSMLQRLHLQVVPANSGVKVRVALSF